MTSDFSSPARSARPWILLFIATCLVAANMRMTITGVGALLEEIADDRGVPTAALGALGSVPLAAWALVSPLGHWLSARIGMSNGVSLALVVLAGGTMWRSLPGSPLNLWLGTALIGVGLAIANVLMPATIKRDFPGHVPAVMGVYTALLSGVGAVAAGMVVPLSAVQTPSGGTFGWAGALLATGALLPVALIVWAWARRGEPRPERDGTSGRAVATAATVATATPTATPESAAAEPATARSAGRRIWGDPLAWLVSIYMGSQSMLYYAMATWLAPYLISLGQSHEAAGYGLMAFQLIGIAGSLLTPLFLRSRMQRWVPAAVPVVGAIGWVGMLSVPAAMPVWLILGGLAGGAQLAVSLTLMAERARTGEHAAALSGMAQSVGYAVAALGPALFGLFLGLTGGWTLSFLFVCAAAAVQFAVGLAVRRDRFVLA